MFRSTTTRIVIGVVAALMVLALLRFKPWQRWGAGDEGATLARAKLNVGFLPVT